MGYGMRSFLNVRVTFIRLSHTDASRRLRGRVAGGTNGAMVSPQRRGDAEISAEKTEEHTGWFSLRWPLRLCVSAGNGSVAASRRYLEITGPLRSCPVACHEPILD